MGEEQNLHDVEEVVTAQTETHEIVHEQTLFAEPLWHIGGFPITNSLMVSWTVVILIILGSLILRVLLKKVPGKIQGAMEMVFEWFLETFDSITGSRQKSLQFFPLIFAFFIFILLNNWFGLLPGVGTIGQVVNEYGELVFVPYLRGGTADLNTTLALALIAIIASHLFGIFKIGPWTHLNKFINIKAFLEIPKKIMKEPTIILVNPIKAFVGIVEVVGEVAKVASLSFRLFGNIFAGEVLLASMAALVAWIVPIPFMFLELIVGVIQALIFAMLTLAFLTINTSEEH
ncbi:ATP synthase F0 subunit A [Candidatus Falkowbacteria bacterium CG10_big_fil_rev_8_21_14_0_10_43_11]|uniref:ATP synthase subunit a n=1 Tax=Candidatus Falkowbacteria bacterium CG10_big_fil_rev_8_21_14_0_10_43_11 TaxID=1974568 RepID=A0A2M6WLC5_9BACT|nr:MAG: ATP synthase F0 subunit A [Candidatus Falkowbacteria bacterium CG10_big_fil_rev_8_21_14_0_10_43_11]